MVTKKYIRISLAGLLALLVWAGCSKDYPLDEDGLLITTRTECYVSNFELLGSDFRTVISGSPEIDTLACTIHVQVFYGTDLTHLYPQFSLASDCKLDPKVTGMVDFSDTTNPKSYTVVSGNRKIRKPYTIQVSVIQP